MLCEDNFWQGNTFAEQLNQAYDDFRSFLRSRKITCSQKRFTPRLVTGSDENKHRVAFGMTWKVLRCFQCLSQHDIISTWYVIFNLRLSRRMVSFCSLQRHIAIDVSWSGFTMQWQELAELRPIPELHLSNCAWNWYQIKGCFCIICTCTVWCCNRSYICVCNTARHPS